MAAEARNALFGVISTTANPLPRCAALMENSVIDLSKFWRLRGHAFGEIPAEVDIAGIFQNVSSPFNPILSGLDVFNANKHYPRT